jgi:C_GCAxxG_C_C family probable redox protein
MGGSGHTERAQRKLTIYSAWCIETSPMRKNKGVRISQAETADLKALPMSRYRKRWEGILMTAETISPDFESLKRRVQELAKGLEDREAVEARLQQLARQGIFQKEMNPEELIAQKEEILERVQKRAEAYEQVNQSCAKSAALAVMEEFGYGDMKVITALSSFPGIALTGETCGGVTGAMAALCLYFGKDDLLDYNANARTYGKCRKLIQSFEQTLGTTKCREIHETVVFGQYHDVADMKEGYPAFLADNGFEKCGLPPGIGARIAAEIIIEDMERREGREETGNR